MRIVHETNLINAGVFESGEWTTIREEIHNSIASVVWPKGASNFSINPVRKGNGVKPIKDGCMIVLRERFRWKTEEFIFPRGFKKVGKVDALKQTQTKPFVLEWETGNISSSHRSLNRIALGLLHGIIVGGVLVLPTRNTYKYLTDRIGNYEELEPYFQIWKSLHVEQGFMTVIAIEHDHIDPKVPLITKGTDGRALV